MVNSTKAGIRYTAVIPVFNSAEIVGRTISQTAAFFEAHNLDYEIIAVNDGSRDASWESLLEQSGRNPHVIAVNLLRNYGQHTAIYCGLHMAQGDYVVTLDDDLQNPPTEIAHLIAKAAEGHDLVFGQFQIKQHTWARVLGSRLIRWMNQNMFGSPPELVLSNFRLIRRDVVERITAYRTAYPYITGLALMFASSPAHITVRHEPRTQGKSTYNLWRILQLVARITFNYSSFPLRVVSGLGLLSAGGSFLIGCYFLVLSLLGEVGVRGWASLFILQAFLNGLIIFMLSMLGEYLVRLVNQTSTGTAYYVKESRNLKGQQQGDPQYPH